MKQQLLLHFRQLASILLVALLMPIGAWANPVSEQTARQQATIFARQHGLPTSLHQVSCQTARRSGAIQPSYYVYNIGQQQGFVIISGDDRTELILGYSDCGSFDEQNMPDNMRTWLQGYERQISSIPNIPLTSSMNSGRRAIEPVRKVIAPLILTKWDQGAENNYMSSPYNKLCPKIGYYYCYTGCAATALAQLMYRFQWPQDATPSIPEYKINHYKYDKYNDVVPELDPIVFDWANMLLRYEFDPISGDYKCTEEQSTAVAQLMRYAGQAVRMYYGYNSSGSNMVDLAPALTTYFGYDKRTTRLLTRAYYSNADWEQKVYDELVSGCPVVYDGYTDLYSSGHVFLCDGYDGDGFFHINWGWGGNCNGYFRLSVLNPEDTSGAGASSSIYGYTYDQEAIFGALPTSNEAREDLHALTFETFNYAPSELQLRMICRNNVSELLNYEMGIGYYDADGNLQTLVSKTEDSMGYGFYTEFLFFNDWSVLPQGSYVFYPMSRVVGSSQWDVLTNPDRAIYAEIDSEHNPTLHHYADLSTILTVTATNLEGSGYRNENHKLTVTIKNEGPEYYGPIYIYGKYAAEDSYSDLTETMVSIPANGEETVTLYFKPNQIGNLSLVITRGYYASGYDNYKLSGNSELNITISDYPYSPTGDVTKLKAVNIVVDNMTVEGGNNVVYTNGAITGSMTIKNEGVEAYSGQVQIFCYVPYHNEWYDGGTLVINEMQYPAGQYYATLSLGSGEEKDVDFNFEMQSPSQWWQSVDGTSPETIRHRIGLLVEDGQEPVLNGEVSVYPYYGVTIAHSNGTSDVVSYKQEIVVPPTAVYVDLRGFSGNGIVLNTTNAQPNCLYLRNGNEEDITGLPTKNVIKGAVAEKMELTDGYDFVPPFDFTAQQITFTRKATIGANATGGGWQPFVLPFAANKVVRADSEVELKWFQSASETGKNLWIKDFVGIDGTTALFGFAPATLEPYHPYIIAVPDASWGIAWDLRNVPLRFEGDNANIIADARCNVNTSVWKYTGTMTTASGADVYTINTTGTTFKRQTTATLNPFSAWFVNKSAGSGAPELIIGDIDGNTTAIREMSNKTATDNSYYNLNGQRMSGSMNQLPKGIYIYNGKKIRK